jgi:predicted enzyme related to lactoylglutathione lyase
MYSGYMKKSKLLMQLNGAVFYSTDLDAIDDFYTNLGFELEFREEDNYISFLLPQGGRLGVKLASEEREVPGHQTIQVLTNDIEACRAKVDKTDAEIYQDTRVIKDWGTYFEILDPDANKITFVQLED